MNFKKLLATAACGLAFASAAEATVVTVYTDKALWQAAVGSFLTEDFADGTLLPGMTITGGSVFSGVFNDVANGGVTTYSFAGALDAFGGNFDLRAGGPGTGLALTLAGGETIDFAIPQQIPSNYSGGFFGFVSDTSFTSVAFRMGTQALGQETYSTDNVVISAAEIPEPGSLALLGLGLAGLAAARKRKQA